MKNVEVKIEKNKLIMTVDLTKEFGPSSSGKTIIVASSEGNQSIDYKGKEPGDFKIGVNVYRKPPNEKK